jgi:lactoylglutathione lyase
VLKIGDRQGAIHFFKEVLGMKVLRHEEFEKGCEATCNGPYDGKWSKTMIGFGPEDDNFVLELTYNYGISEYRHGNDFVAIDVLKKDVSAVAATGAKLEELSGNNKGYIMESNGYRFNIFQDNKGDKISRVTLACSDLTRTMNFYVDTLNMLKIDGSLMYGEDQCKLLFNSTEGTKLDRGQAFGRIAFSCPTEQLESLEAWAKNSMHGESVQTPLVTLPTPGKADVKVIILADADLHEICFVGDEGFRELSKVDPDGDKLLEEAIAADKSDEWFAKKGLQKEKHMD